MGAPAGRLWAIAFISVALLAASCPAPAAAQATTKAGPGITVTTDAGAYWPGQTVHITILNSGDETLEGTPELSVAQADGPGHAVWSPAFAQFVVRLEPGQTLPFEWDQSADDGTKAPPAAYVVRASFGGQQAETRFEILGSEAAPRLAFSVARSEFLQGQLVQVTIQNTGTADFEGGIEFSVAPQIVCIAAPCIPPQAWSEADGEPGLGHGLPAGASMTWDWEQQTFSGPAGPGSWAITATWYSLQRHGGTQTMSFSILERQTASAPVLKMGPPDDLATYGDEVPVHVAGSDPDGLLRFQLFAYAGSGFAVPLLSTWWGREGIPSFELDDVVAAERFPAPSGSNRVYAVVSDTAGSATVKVLSISLSPSPKPGIAVATDKSLYGAGEVVQITITNTGPTTLSGTAHYNVSAAPFSRFASRAVPQPTTLGPGDSTSFRWDQRDAAGEPVPPGKYVLYAGFDEDGDPSRHHHAAAQFEVQTGLLPAFDLQVVVPVPGSTVTDALSVTMRVGAPGASSLHVDVVGPSPAAADRSFPTPFTGDIVLSFDGASLPVGEYKVLATASGPAGKTSASSWFSVLLPASADRLFPMLQVLYPTEGPEVPTRFPVVFQAKDDVGIVYAEAYLRTDDGTDTLVARHSWPVPVMAGAFVVDATSFAPGTRLLAVKVYDPGEHAAKLEMKVTLSAEATLPCAAGPTVEPALGEEARPAEASPRPASTTTEEAAEPAPPPSEPAPTAQPATPAADSADWCWTYGFGPLVPAELPTSATARPAEPFTSPTMALEVAPDGTVADFKVGGTVVIQRIEPSIGDVAGASSASGGKSVFQGATGAIVAGQKLLLITSASGEVVAMDLSPSFIVSKRERNILLEGPDGTLVAIVVTDGDVRVLGSRLLADLAAGGSVVARPIDMGSEVELFLSDSLVAGLVGAEIDVGADGSQTQTYSPLDVDVRLEDAEKGQRVVATLSTQDHSGRLLVFSLGDDVDLGTSVEVLLDGALIGKASSIEDVVDPADDDGSSEYYVVFDDGVPKVLVSIGHFSERVLVIQAAGIALPPFVTVPAMAIAAAVVIGAALLVFRRPKEP